MIPTWLLGLLFFGSFLCSARGLGNCMQNSNLKHHEIYFAFGSLCVFFFCLIYMAAVAFL